MPTYTLSALTILLLLILGGYVVYQSRRNRESELAFKLRESARKFSRDSGKNYSVSNPAANRQKDPRIQLGSVYPSNRLALVRAKRSVTALRRAIGIGHDNAAVGRQYLL